MDGISTVNWRVSASVNASSYARMDPLPTRFSLRPSRTTRTYATICEPSLQRTFSNRSTVTSSFLLNFLQEDKIAHHKKLFHICNWTMNRTAL